MDKVWILGASGSVSVSGRHRMKYGGATTSVLVKLDGHYILLDAGTGIMSLPAEVLEEPAIELLLTHFHLDHLIGLPLCPYLMNSEHCLTVYAGRHEGLEAKDALSRLFTPPFWPVTLEQLPAKVCYEPLTEHCILDTVRVDVLPGDHPNGVNLLRLTGMRHSVVLATDCTLTPELLPITKGFAQGCDLLLVDGQYSAAEWENRSHFGHSAWRAAAELARDCGAKRLRIVHHDPSHSDVQLDEAEREVREVVPTGRMAREGEEVLL